MNSPVTLADDGASGGRDQLRRMALAADDPAQCAFLMAAAGTLDLEDLWWLRENHDVVVEAAGWLLVMIRAGHIDRDEIERMRRWSPYRPDGNDEDGS